MHKIIFIYIYEMVYNEILKKKKNNFFPSYFTVNLPTINLYYHYELVSSYNNLTNNILLPANQKLLPVSKLSFLAPTTDRAWPLVFIYFVLFTTELWQLTMVCRESRSGQQTVSSSTTRGIMRPAIGMRVFSDRPHG